MHGCHLNLFVPMYVSVTSSRQRARKSPDNPLFTLEGLKCSQWVSEMLSCKTSSSGCVPFLIFILEHPLAPVLRGDFFSLMLTMTCSFRRAIAVQPASVSTSPCSVTCGLRFHSGFMTWEAWARSVRSSCCPQPGQHCSLMV